MFTLGDWRESTQSGEIRTGSDTLPTTGTAVRRFCGLTKKRGESGLPSAADRSGTTLWAGSWHFLFSPFTVPEARTFFWSSRLVLLICSACYWVSGQLFVPCVWDVDRNVGAESWESRIGLQKSMRWGGGIQARQGPLWKRWGSKKRGGGLKMTDLRETLETTQLDPWRSKVWQTLPEKCITVHIHLIPGSFVGMAAVGEAV